ncbi:Na+/H+-dicarboxylate symporter [Arcanobacterium pluranimalium]|uniref:dicarboxylate/amino acid:cation symporter n=1 Tax=Arcanobacterium pluranimalium TaxID=108028 RepID=UPI00195DA2E6|nr:dicarboxylate/amino acid:cation symporter [Arcanobacterium pluranimalium]MBM7824633.1 Na+/H+-dicarboxylate symporter [Arcanobacterium pluranimalium]
MQTTQTKKRKILPSFGTQILLSLIIGGLLGWVALRMGSPAPDQPNWLTFTLSTIGSSFITLLKAVVPVLVFTAIVASIANLRGVANGTRLAVKTLLWFAITAFISVSIGIIIGLVTNPGMNATISAANSNSSKPAHTGNWLDFLIGLVPSNFLGIQASSTADSATNAISTTINFNVLQIIVIALVVGAAALRQGHKAEAFLTFNASLLSVVQRILWWIIRLAPIGTIGLVGRAVATYGWTSIAQLSVFAAAIYLGLAIVLFGVYPIILRANGLGIRQFFRGAWPAIQLAFVSRSSIGTLPVTQAVTEKNLGVPSSYASFAVPLASTTKMDGCASIYPAISAIFVSQFFNLPLGPVDYLLIIFVSVVGSAATAGLTGATVMLTLMLSTLGLPLEGVGLLLAIDPILDMGRTAVNVAGQIVVAAVVAKREGIIDMAKYESASSSDLFDDDADAATNGANAGSGNGTGTGSDTDDADDATSTGEPADETPVQTAAANATEPSGVGTLKN